MTGLIDELLERVEAMEPAVKAQAALLAHKQLGSPYVGRQSEAYDCLATNYFTAAPQARATPSWLSVSLLWSIAARRSSAASRMP